MADLVTLTIDGLKTSVPKGTLASEAATQLGIDVPKIKGITSAVAGSLKPESKRCDAVTVSYAPGYGDILRVVR
jgi:hypothetical protein